ncbi:hypothetical protein BC834DRAFT_98793 [Gloeopeniophorella convolvens]|nr:hypothetical protein BC834DRAFT_98793 [Gloeopeniophorella convolvens]
MRGQPHRVATELIPLLTLSYPRSSQSVSEMGNRLFTDGASLPVLGLKYEGARRRKSTTHLRIISHWSSHHTASHPLSNRLSIVMSVELSKRKKTDAPQRPNASVPDGDHRKRRRNRTTQSCLNCHTSKRMCDRKRPCGRCTQLGITGLCVYEVDDPSQRADVADDKSRLQKRVAELEGVIRELKHKPHPRWTQPQSDVYQEQQGLAPTVYISSPRSSLEHLPQVPHCGKGGVDAPSMSPKGVSTSPSPLLVPSRGLSRRSSLAPPSFEEMPEPRLPSFGGPFSVSPSSSGSSPLATPEIDDAAMPFLSTFSPTPQVPPNDNMASLLSYFAEGDAQGGTCFADFFDNTLRDMACDKAADGFLSQHPGHHAPLGECGCLSDAANYHAVLELSLRLRRAAEVLSRHPPHSAGSMCLLKHRIAELDVFTSSTLGNMDTPGLNVYSHPGAAHPGHSPHMECASPGAGWQGGPAPFTSPSSISPQTLVQQHDDSLMSWAPQRHRSMSMTSAPIS